ncbi:unnamed protein product, partial [Didymodactylos carnosus]
MNVKHLNKTETKVIDQLNSYHKKFKTNDTRSILTTTNYYPQKYISAHTCYASTLFKDYLRDQPTYLQENCVIEYSGFKTNLGEIHAHLTRQGQIRKKQQKYLGQNWNAHNEQRYVSQKRQSKPTSLLQPYTSESKQSLSHSQKHISNNNNDDDGFREYLINALSSKTSNNNRHHHHHVNLCRAVTNLRENDRKRVSLSSSDSQDHEVEYYMNRQQRIIMEQARTDNSDKEQPTRTRTNGPIIPAIIHQIDRLTTNKSDYTTETVFITGNNDIRRPIPIRPTIITGGEQHHIIIDQWKEKTDETDEKIAVSTNKSFKASNDDKSQIIHHQSRSWYHDRTQSWRKLAANILPSQLCKIQRFQQEAQRKNIMTIPSKGKQQFEQLIKPLLKMNKQLPTNKSHYQPNSFDKQHSHVVQQIMPSPLHRNQQSTGQQLENSDISSSVTFQQINEQPKETPLVNDKVEHLTSLSMSSFSSTSVSSCNILSIKSADMNKILESSDITKSSLRTAHPYLLNSCQSFTKSSLLLNDSKTILQSIESPILKITSLQNSLTLTDTNLNYPLNELTFFDNPTTQTSPPQISARFLVFDQLLASFLSINHQKWLLPLPSLRVEENFQQLVPSHINNLINHLLIFDENRDDGSKNHQESTTIDELLVMSKPIDVVLNSEIDLYRLKNFYNNVQKWNDSMIEECNNNDRIIEVKNDSVHSLVVHQTPTKSSELLCRTPPYMIQELCLLIRKLLDQQRQLNNHKYDLQPTIVLQLEILLDHLTGENTFHDKNFQLQIYRNNGIFQQTDNHIQIYENNNTSVYEDTSQYQNIICSKDTVTRAISTDDLIFQQQGQKQISVVATQTNNTEMLDKQQQYSSSPFLIEFSDNNKLKCKKTKHNEHGDGVEQLSKTLSEVYHCPKKLLKTYSDEYLFLPHFNETPFDQLQNTTDHMKDTLVLNSDVEISISSSLFSMADESETFTIEKSLLPLPSVANSPSKTENSISSMKTLNLNPHLTSAHSDTYIYSIRRSSSINCRKIGSQTSYNTLMKKLKSNNNNKYQCLLLNRMQKFSNLIELESSTAVEASTEFTPDFFGGDSVLNNRTEQFGIDDADAEQKKVDDRTSISDGGTMSLPTEDEIQKETRTKQTQTKPIDDDLSNQEATLTESFGSFEQQSLDFNIDNENLRENEAQQRSRNGEKISGEEEQSYANFENQLQKVFDPYSKNCDAVINLKNNFVNMEHFIEKSWMQPQQSPLADDEIISNHKWHEVKIYLQQHNMSDKTLPIEHQSLISDSSLSTSFQQAKVSERIENIIEDDLKSVCDVEEEDSKYVQKSLAIDVFTTSLFDNKQNLMDKSIDFYRTKEHEMTTNYEFVHTIQIPNYGLSCNEENSHKKYSKIEFKKRSISTNNSNISSGFKVKHVNIKKQLIADINNRGRSTSIAGKQVRVHSRQSTPSPLKQQQIPTYLTFLNQNNNKSQCLSTEVNYNDNFNKLIIRSSSDCNSYSHSENLISVKNKEDSNDSQSLHLADLESISLSNRISQQQMCSTHYQLNNKSIFAQAYLTLPSVDDGKSAHRSLPEQGQNCSPSKGVVSSLIQR